MLALLTYSFLKALSAFLLNIITAWRVLAQRHDRNEWQIRVILMAFGVPAAILVQTELCSPTITEIPSLAQPMQPPIEDQFHEGNL